MSAVLFDLDNTLTHRGLTINKYADVFRNDFQRLFTGDVDHSWLAERLQELDENGYAGHDKRSAGIRALEIWCNTPSIKTLNAHWIAWLPHNPVPMPGLYETLDFFKEQGFRLGIITNGSVEAQTAKIVALGLDAYFGCITISEEYGMKKPDKRIFHMTLRKMAQLGKKSYFVGDHPMLDILGAKEAGLIPVWLRGFQQWPESMERPAYIADNLFSVTEIISLIDSKP